MKHLTQHLRRLHAQVSSVLKNHRLDVETKRLVLVWTLQPKLRCKSTQVLLNSGFNMLQLVMRGVDGVAAGARGRVGARREGKDQSGRRDRAVMVGKQARVWPRGR